MVRYYMSQMLQFTIKMKCYSNFIFLVRHIKKLISSLFLHSIDYVMINKPKHILPLIIQNCRYISQAFIPKHSPVQKDDLDKLNNFINEHNSIFVLTGAGISTESGIPDYRSAKVGLYARINHKPVQFNDFLRSAEVRKRYWARNFVGWPVFSQREPNINHFVICDLEKIHKKVLVVTTQNVDRLHHKAGSENVIELHGSGYEVICLKCDYRIDRQQFQEHLNDLNPTMVKSTGIIRPDGDVEINQDQIDKFVLPNCPKCYYGMLKPDIVFFGDTVPQKRAVAITNYVEECDALLVFGSSLTVFSSFRIVLQAYEAKIPIIIVNIGETRGDNLATMKISAKCGDVLSKLVL